MPRTNTTRSKILWQSNEIILNFEVILERLKKIDDLAAGRSNWIEQQLPLLTQAHEKVKAEFEIFHNKLCVSRQVFLQDGLPALMEDVASLLQLIEKTPGVIMGSSPDVGQAEIKQIADTVSDLHQLFVLFHNGL